MIKTSVSAILISIIAFAAGDSGSGDGGIYTIRPQPVTEACLACICHATSECKLEKTCAGDKNSTCGHFKIRFGRWEAAGKPKNDTKHFDNDLDAFKDCAVNPACSAIVMTTYFTQNGKDCNHDGLIDCYDYAMIEERGLEACTEKKLDTKWWDTFTNCTNLLDRVSWMF